MCVTSPLFSYDFEVDGIYYNRNNNNVSVTVGDELYRGDISIPETVFYRNRTFAVSAIEGGAFSECTELTSISIPNNVSDIGHNAFAGCTNLKNVCLPNGLTVIESDLFDGCSSLTNVIIPSSVTNIEVAAFYECKNLVSVILPDSLTSIGQFAFKYCSSLESITIPNGVKSIQYESFDGCTSLKFVNLPETLERIEQCAFRGTKIQDIFIPKRVEFIDREAFEGSGGNRKSIVVDKENKHYNSYGDCNAIIDTEKKTLILGCNRTTIPDGIVEIGAWAFYECEEISHIVLPQTITKVDDYAFYFCRNLEKINLPEGLTYVGRLAFDVTSLSHIDLPSTLTYIGDEAFKCHLKEIVIPANVTYIGESIVGGSYLERITVDHQNTHYDSRGNCNAIIETKSNKLIAGCMSSIIPEGIEVIDNNAFQHSLLSNCAIPNSVKRIGKRAFWFCNMNTIKIPSSVEEIGWEAFVGTGVTDIYVDREVPLEIEESVLSGSFVLHVPSGTKSAYRAACGWNKALLIVEPSNNVIYYTSSDNAIVEPYYDDEFGANIISNVYEDGAGTITFDGDVTQIGDESFYECTTLKRIVLPSTVSRIGKKAFSGRETENHSELGAGLESITFPDNLKVIDESAFKNCPRLAKVSFNDNLERINDEAFYQCRNIDNIRIPSKVSYIGQNAFWFCELAIISVDQENTTYRSKNDCIIENSSDSLMYGTYYSIVPSGIKKIAPFAFYCASPQVIDIPGTVTSIGQEAFGDAWYGFYSGSLRVIVHWSTPLEIDGSVFSGAPSSTLFVPKGTKALYESAIGWKNFGTIVENDSDFIEIADGTAYSRVEDITTNVKYTRSFGSTAWQSFYVPFSIPVEKLKEYGLTVAELNDTHQWDFDGDGIADSTRVEFFTLSSASTLANHPYLIKADEAFDLTLELSDVELKSAEENSLDCSSTKQMFTFCGTYTGVSGADMYNNNYYAMAGGSLKRVSGPGVSLKPQRWYLKIENRNGTPVKYFAPTIRISIDGIDGEPDATGLSSVICREEDNVIYGLDGVRQDASRLTKGLYIQNGQKVIVR